MDKLVKTLTFVDASEKQLASSLAGGGCGFVILGRQAQEENLQKTTKSK